MVTCSSHVLFQGHGFNKNIGVLKLECYKCVDACRAGTRAGNNGVYARSEAELEQIMDGLHEQEVNTGVSLVLVGISFLGLRTIHSLKKIDSYFDD